MNPLSEVINRSRILVCVGSGGVGKTTTSAIIGLHAALQGQRVLVMTIDPARRLANSLGLDALNDEVQKIDLEPLGAESGGEMWATMLDMKRAFDDIVDQYAADEKTRRAIFNNRFYHFFSTSLAGAQELSASERLYEVARSGKYDLVVLDTPPTANALDFLEAPMRYYDALDSAAFNLVMRSSEGRSRKGGLLGIGVHFVIRTLGRFTGEEFFEELGEFLAHFSSLFEGFRERTRATAELFGDAGTAFVIVTSPDPLTAKEALFFRKRLGELRVRLGGLVVNRVRQAFDDNTLKEGPLHSLVDALAGIEGAGLIPRPILERLASRLRENAAQFDVLAAKDQEVCDELASTLRPAPVLQAPLFSTDVHDLASLDALRRSIFRESTD